MTKSNDVQLVENALDEFNGRLNEHYQKMQDQIDELAQKNGTPAGFGQTGQKSVSTTVATSEKLQALRDRSVKSVIVPSDASIKAVVGDAGGDGDDAFNVQPNRATGVFNDPRRRLSLLDLLPTIQVSTNSFEFVSLDGFVDAAAYQLAEGDAKAEQAMPTALQTANIATIAAVLHASEQVLADTPALSQFIQSRLVYGVRQKLEAEIVAGAGGTGQISGLLTEATAFTPTASIASADAIGEAIAHLESLGWMPGAVLLHPNDWQTIRSERTSGGEYVATGWDSPAGPNVWGVPAVVTSAMTEGTVVVMDPAQTVMLDRMSAGFAFNYSGDGFTTNVITGRAELRAGLAVMAPTAVQKFTIPVA
ncbi:phage major capsid protein [Halomonas smyrnensis]|uniref:phage major capsid protein n=1 Tax=Halomonas smyrnensis TaxID=720605 RepID=UPI0002E8CC91|nr:phage major capsid protein [Halomonas smyrnensis]